MRTGYYYSVQLIPQDAAEAVGTPGAVVGVVEGYGTVQIADRVETFPLCEVLVDVNEGQLMRARAKSIIREGGRTPRPEDAVCRRAEDVARDAVNAARDLMA